jgi:ribonuclease P protein component
VRQAGTAIRLEDLDVRAVLTERGRPRVGFVVPKYKRSSVDRNLLKRRLRELVRTRLLPQLRGAGETRRGVDIVVRALPTAYRISMTELTARIDRAAASLDQRLAAAPME